MLRQNRSCKRGIRVWPSWDFPLSWSEDRGTFRRQEKTSSEDEVPLLEEGVAQETVWWPLGRGLGALRLGIYLALRHLPAFGLWLGPR